MTGRLVYSAGKPEQCLSVTHLWPRPPGVAGKPHHAYGCIKQTSLQHPSSASAMLSFIKCSRCRSSQQTQQTGPLLAGPAPAHQAAPTPSFPAGIPPSNQGQSSPLVRLCRPRGDALSGDQTELPLGLPVARNSEYLLSDSGRKILFMTLLLP